MSRLDELLARGNNQDVLFDVLDPIWDKCLDGTKMEALSAVEASIIYSQMTQDSINGGGINTMFYNEARTLPTEGLKAFKAIGADKAAAILERAIAIFPKQPIPSDLEECRQVLEAMEDENTIDDEWHELSDQFYGLDDYMIPITLEYMRNHRDELSNLY